MLETQHSIGMRGCLRMFGSWPIIPSRHPNISWWSATAARHMTDMATDLWNLDGIWWDSVLPQKWPFHIISFVYICDPCELWTMLNIYSANTHFIDRSKKTRLQPIPCPNFIIFIPELWVTFVCSTQTSLGGNHSLIGGSTPSEKY